MKDEDLIPIEVFFKHYPLESSFVSDLKEYGLIEVTEIDNRPCIGHEHISDFEKLIHLHYDLSINIEGIDAIHHLLQKIVGLQKELCILKTKLRSYEHAVSNDPNKTNV